MDFNSFQLIIETSPEGRWINYWMFNSDLQMVIHFQKSSEGMVFPTTSINLSESLNSLLDVVKFKVMAGNYFD